MIAGVQAAPYLYLAGSGDLIPHGIRRRIKRAERRLAGEGLTAVVTSRNRGHWVHLMRPVIEQAHRDRDRSAGRPCDLDDPQVLAAWRAAWISSARAQRLEVSVLEFTGSGPGAEMAAYCIAILDPPAYRVIDSRMMTRWRDFVPGRMLEDRIISKLQASPDYDLVDWGSTDHAHALIAVS